MDSFDEHQAFRDKLEDYPLEAIPDHLSWDKTGPAILQGLEKGKKRRRFLFWWWGIGIGVIGCLLVVWWGYPAILKTQIAAFKVEVVTTKEETSQEIVDKKPTEIDLGDPTKDEENSVLASKGRKMKQLTKVEQLSNADKKGDSIFGEENLSSNRGLEIPENTVPPTRKIPTIHQQVANFNLMLEDNKVVPLSVEKELSINTATTQIVAGKKKNAPILAVEKLPILTNFLPDQKRVVSIQLYDNHNSHKWQFEIAGGTNWWQQGQTILSEADTINTSLVGWQLNARINRYFGKNWSLAVGLNLQNLRYKSAFNFTEGASIYQPRTIDAIFTNSLTGEQTVTYRDSIPGLRTRNFQHFNQHTSLQLPILVGVTVGKKRWRYALRSGIGLQFFQHHSGRTALALGDVTDLPDRNFYPFKVRLSFLLEGQLAYKISKRISLLGRVGTEHNLTNWLSSNSEFEQRPQIVNSSVGLAWIF
ncbi:MAG: hypothetical protein AAGJ18_13745 [Bacteroidota bacterium]